MTNQIQNKIRVRAFAGGVGLLTTLGLGIALSIPSSANAKSVMTKSASAKSASAKSASAKSATAKSTPHFRVSAAQASATVLKKFPGKVTEKVTLEDEEGTWQYGVMVRSGRVLREVMVDAKTGKIANIEVTTVGKEQVEQKNETATEAAAKVKKNAATKRK